MARVLVTGASGFIGSTLTRRLVERGDDVTCLVRASSNVSALEPLDVRLALGDVRDPQAVRAAIKNVDVVYHVAGLVSALRADDLMQVNATACRHVAAACAECPTPPTLVFVSSLAAAGPSAADRPRTESDMPAPVSHYGRTKRAGELIAEEFAAKLPITVVRPPIVFGEGDPLMRDAFRLIHRFGFHFAVGVGSSHYSMIHVADLVDALVLCGQRGARLAPVSDGNGTVSKSSQGYYFVSADEQPTFSELGQLIGQSLGVARVRVLRSSSATLLWPVAALAETIARLRGRPYILNFDKVREARAGHWTCSSQTIRSELGFVPGAPLTDRLRQTAEWYRQQELL